MRPVSLGEHETRRIGAPAGWDYAKDGAVGALSVCDMDQHARQEADGAGSGGAGQREPGHA